MKVTVDGAPSPRAVRPLHRPPDPPSVVVGGRRLVALMRRVTRPLTVIIAPAGAGKTCTLSYWAWQQDETPLWFDARRAKHRYSLHEFLSGDDGHIAVVDNAHELTPSDLAIVVDAVTQGGRRVVLTSRRELQLPVVALELSGQLAIVRGDHLRLTAEETVELIRALAPKAHEQDVQAVAERAGGWAAAAVLASRVLASVADREQASAALVASDQPVLDYLFHEVYSALPASTRHVLLCIADEQGVTEEAARVLSADPAAPGRLAQLAVEGTFVSQRDAPGSGDPLWFCHPLLVELLRRHVAPGRADARLVSAAHTRAAVHYAAVDDDPEALRHAVASGDPNLVVELLVRLAPRLLAAGFGEAIRQAIAAVPTRQRAGNRTLLVISAQERRAAGDVEAVLRIVGELSPMNAPAGEDADRPGGTSPADALAAIVDADEADLRLWLTRIGYGDVRTAIDQAMTWLRPEATPGRTPSPLDPARLAALAVDVTYATMWTDGAATAEYAHWAAGLSRATGLAVLNAAAESVIAMTELKAGRFQTAAEVARDALDLMGGETHPEEACLRAVIGCAAWYALDAAEARRQLDLARSALVPAIDPVGAALVRQLAARVLADEGRIAGARRAMDSHAETLLTPPFLRAALDLLRAELALLAGDTAAAEAQITALRAHGWASAASLLVAAVSFRHGKPELTLPPVTERAGAPRWDVCVAGAALYRLLRDLESGVATREGVRERLRDLLSRCAPQRLVRVFLPGATVPEFVALLSREVDESEGYCFAGEVLAALSGFDPAAAIPTSPDVTAPDVGSPAPEPELASEQAADVPDASRSPLRPSSTRTGHLLAVASPDAASTAGHRPLRTLRAPAALAPVPRLTKRELDVLTRLARGDSYLDVAEHLFITENTVKTHVASLYRKLNAGRRAEALRTAWALGLLTEVHATAPLADERRSL